MSNLFLIGYRCTGKTSAGKALAATLGWTFVDTDRIIVDEVGGSIAEFVAARGWTAFRETERQVIARLSQQDRQVIATGGGAVMTTENVRSMRSGGKVIWLQAAPETIRRRMRADAGTATGRPSLTGQGSLEEIETVLAKRKTHYAAAAHYVIDTDGLSITEVVSKIIVIIGELSTDSTDLIDPTDLTDSTDPTD
ncbi:MAG: shikimate kinase [Desulfobacterales bacterium]